MAVHLIAKLRSAVNSLSLGASGYSGVESHVVVSPTGGIAVAMFDGVNGIAVHNEIHYPSNERLPVSDNPRAKFHELLNGFSVAMLVTGTESGDMRARPMTLAEVQDDADLWFLTTAEDGKVDELKSQPACCVTMADGRTFLSLTANATVKKDPAKVKSLWNPAWQTWFPDGPESDSIVLLHVQPTQAEYWDTAGLSGMQYVFRAGKAFLEGERPKMTDAMHSKVDL